MTVFKKYPSTKADIGPDIPEKWREHVQEGKWFCYDIRRGELPFYPLQKGQLKEDVFGKAIGKREVAYRLGWWREGMTEKGKRAALEATLNAPRKFQHGDLVARKEPWEDDPTKFCFQLYKIIEVPLTHADTSSTVDII